ncbi:hypothetical protein [Pseudomonas syringae]|uniref:Uncharacterized protein n=1 Tax=Pseudomonas syringae TaxID=317 RepID=A0AB38BY25_PSESX|nr:hypothetical protein [Pseudomonas syringae]AKF53250.1 hypothetical protein PsyrH_22650 [Pseudomonas syringae pv. syringae HS191]MBI6559679.1 hypothetical protein [Pseudomonas syringae]MBI6572667.1 hypothetical protein [Pseudomonas syringae]MBI6589711.1 hypothetical protein [Pseudomonas syringae]MBI6593209.1 hypothetical protein [Pseudomonas syringae]
MAMSCRNVLDRPRAGVPLDGQGVEYGTSHWYQVMLSGLSKGGVDEPVGLCKS